jgi:hypothetical protein
MSLEITSTAAEIDAHIIDVLRHRVGKDERAAKPHDWFTATVLTLRDHVIDRWMESTRKTYAESGKRVYYLSLEFLIGRLLRDALSNMGMTRDMERRCANTVWTWPRWRIWSRTRRWATALAAWPRASWKASPASTSRPTATASATKTACSASASTMAGRSSCRKPG